MICKALHNFGVVMPSLVSWHYLLWVFRWDNEHYSFSKVQLWTFKPCSQVLQTCGSPDLVRSVISPHLSMDAVDFLRGHLTPKEMTMFELLGDGWTRPRCVYMWSAAAPAAGFMWSLLNIPPLTEQSGPEISVHLLITPSFEMDGSHLQSFFWRLHGKPRDHPVHLHLPQALTTEDTHLTM